MGFVFSSLYAQAKQAMSDHNYTKAQNDLEECVKIYQHLKKSSPKIYTLYLANTYMALAKLYHQTQRQHKKEFTYTNIF